MAGEIREPKLSEKEKVKEENLEWERKIESLKTKFPYAFSAMEEEIKNLKKETEEIKEEFPKIKEVIGVLEKIAKEAGFKEVVLVPEGAGVQMGVYPLKFPIFSEKALHNFQELIDLDSTFTKDGWKFYLEVQEEGFRGKNLKKLEEGIKKLDDAFKKEGKLTEKIEKEMEELNKEWEIQANRQFYEKRKKIFSGEEIIKTFAQIEAFTRLVKFGIESEPDKEELKRRLSDYYKFLEENMRKRMSKEIIETLEQIRREKNLRLGYA